MPVSPVTPRGSSGSPSTVVRLNFTQSSTKIEHPLTPQKLGGNRGGGENEPMETKEGKDSSPFGDVYPCRAVQRKSVGKLLEESAVGQTLYAVGAGWWENWQAFVGFGEDRDGGSGDPPAEQGLLRKELRKMNPKGLKAFLKSRGLPIQGNKKDLLARALKRLDDEKGAPAAPRAGIAHPGPVETSFSAKRVLKLNEDYVAVPKQVLSALLSWYGGGPERIVSTGTGSPPDPPFSKHQGMPTREQLEESMARLSVSPTATAECKDPETKETVMAEAPKSASAGKRAALDPQNLKRPASPLKVCDFCYQKKRNIKVCTRCKNANYCSKGCQKAHWKTHKKECKVRSTAASGCLGRMGKCGLQNLGNTCFMNSIIQCISHTSPLTTYFLSGRYKEEINKDNVLGFKGKIAEQWGDILGQLWHGSSTSINPLKFKRWTAKLAQGRFSGFAQQDSQEFLTFLLDGIHEDLNRIQKKPYVEQEEHDGTKSDRKVADRAWEGYLKRNASIMADNVMGQEKSTLTCPHCNRVSVTFNPFRNVTLPINPVDSRSIFFVKRCPRRMAEDDGKRVVVHEFSIKSTTTLKDMKKKLSRLHGVAIKHMLPCLVDRQGTVSALLIKDRSISSISKLGQVVMYEITPNAAYMCVYSGSDDRDTYGLPMILSCSPEDSTLSVRQQMLAQKEFIYPKMRIGGTTKNESGPGAFYAATKTGKLKQEAFPVISEKLGQLSISQTVTMGEEWAVKKSKITYAKVLWDSKLVPDIRNFGNDSDSEEDGGRLTLRKCFKDLVAPEVLDEQNYWYCSKCEDHVAATKKIEVWKLPKILILHFKRFHYKNPLYSSKVSDLVEYPLEGLDLGDFCVGGTFNGKKPIYDLYAVSNHYGRMGFGHYTAFARRSTDTTSTDGQNQWFEFDDSRVRQVPSSKVVSEAAYLLFYKQRDE